MPRAGRRIISKKEAKDLFSPEAPKPMVKHQKDVVFDTICEHKEGLSCKDLCNITGIAPRQIRDSIQRLKTDSMVKSFDCRCGSTPYYIMS